MAAQARFLALSLYESVRSGYGHGSRMKNWEKLLTPIVVVGVLMGTLVAPSAAASSGDDFILTFPHLEENTRFVSEFGVAKPDGRSHRGVDLFAARGTPVVAGADGFVETAQTGTRAGLYVVLRHADDFETWYLHLGSLVEGLEVGDPIAAGDIIGFVGSTGNAAGTSPHTHFEIHFNGRAIDPYSYLTEARERWLLSQEIEAGTTRFR